MRTVDELSLIGYELGAAAKSIANEVRKLVNAVTGNCQLPVHVIASHAGVSVPTARRWLAMLDAAGFIEREFVQPADCPQQSNIYHWIGVCVGRAKHQAEQRRAKHRAGAEVRRLYNERKRDDRLRREEKARRKAIAVGVSELYQAKLRRELEDSGAIINERAQQGILYSDMLIPSQALLRLMKEKGWRS